MSKKETKCTCAECKSDETVSHEMCNEMTDAQREAIVYRSKLLNKYYESYDDMLKEEAEFKRQHEEKQKLAEEKKARAHEIEEAKKAAGEARAKAKALIEEADKKYDELVSKFIEDYGSYHESYYNDGKRQVISVGDVIESFFKSWF